MKDQAFYNLCEPQNRTCRKFIPEMSGKSFWQKPCHQGWLIMLCDDDKAKYPIRPNCNYGDCFLCNPLSLETIQLPTLLDWLESDKYCLCDCILSSPPRSDNNPHEDDSMVLFLMEGLEGREGALVFCRPREDKQWRTMVLPREFLVGDFVHSLVCFKRKFYVMCLNNNHLEIDIQLGHDDDDDDETSSIKSFKINHDAHLSVLGVTVGNPEYYFVESCNELFFIEVSPYNPRGDFRGHKNLVASIQIFRLEFSLMAWEKVKSLGDHVLFVGKNTTASCSVANLGLSRGCLYYTMLEDQSLYKYEVEDNAITPILPCLKLPTPWFSASWIMMPTHVRVADGRRKEDMSSKDDEENVAKVEKNKDIILRDDKEIQEQKQKRGELEEARSWCSLNKDMMQLIASYLHPVDYGYFRAACKANRMMIPAPYRRSSSAGIITSIYLSPWLVFSTYNDTIYNFVDPMHNNEEYFMNLPELLVGATIRFSKGGWLLMSKGKDTIFFYNPFTRATIQLPDLTWNVHCTGMAFSSLPTSSDCVVFGIQNDDNQEIFIDVIERGNDSWRSFLAENSNFQKYVPCINNPVFYDGAFYCLDYNGSLGEFSIKNGFTWQVLAKPHGHFSNDCPSFLMECDGKLLSVDLGHHGKSVGIFRLDFSKMTWVKVESLGKHMLFISKTSCFSAIAPHNCMENKIYFPRLQGKGILFYSLDTGKFHSIGSQHVTNGFYDTKEWFNCTWIAPNWTKTTEKELDWFRI